MVDDDGKNDTVELGGEVMMLGGVCDAGLVEYFDGRNATIELEEGVTLTDDFSDVDISSNVLEIDEGVLMAEGKIETTLNDDFDGTNVGIELDEGLFL